MARLYVPSCDPEAVFRLQADGTPVRLGGTVGRGTTDAGGPVAAGRSDCPDGLAFDGAGLLHVVGPGAERLRVVGDGGVVRDVTGRVRDPRRALGLRALLLSPGAVAVDRTGTVYVGGLHADRVLRADAGGALHPLGSGRDPHRPVSDPDRPALLAVLDDLSVCFADGSTDSVFRVDRDGRTTRLVGTGTPGERGEGGPAERAQLVDPRAVALDRAGRLYVTEGAGHKVRRVERDGTLRAVLGIGGSGRAAPLTPGDLAVGPAGDLFVVDLSAGAVRRVDPAGTVSTLGS